MSVPKELECYETVPAIQLTQWNRNWYRYHMVRAVEEMYRYFEKQEPKPRSKYYLKLIGFKDKHLKPLYQKRIKPFYQNRVKPFFIKLFNKIRNNKVVRKVNCYLWKWFCFVKLNYHKVKRGYIKAKIWLITYKFRVRIPRRLKSKGSKVYKRNTPLRLMLTISTI